MALVAGPDGDKHLLFCRDKNEEREIWDGFRYGPMRAREIFGFDEAHPISATAARCCRTLPPTARAVHAAGHAGSWDRKVAETLNKVRNRARSGVGARQRGWTCARALDAMRLMKDAHEVDLMRKAAAISSGAARACDGGHATRAATKTRWRPNWRTNSCATAHRPWPIPSIVASGPNACVLHYRDNNRKMDDGDLLLIDAGCEFQGYASDITRTFPVNGRFTGPQKDIYELVLAAQIAVLDVVKPGATFHD